MAKHTRCPTCGLEYHRIVKYDSSPDFQLMPCGHWINFDNDGHPYPMRKNNA